MKKIFLLLFSAATGFGAIQAQTTVQDSIQTGPAYANDVFYSLKNGKVKENPNNDWQLALSIGVFNVGVRTNATTGSSGVGSVVAYEMPGKDTSKWSSFDTAGYTTWAMVENSDEDWEMGALNHNSSGSDDYGWGLYDATSHNVSGHRLYLLVIKTSGAPLYKKVFIQSKIMGAYQMKYADLNGSNEYSFNIPSTGTYANKNFAFVNMVTNQLVDREPAKADWDFMLTRYRAYQPGQSVYYPSTGILINKGVVVSEARGVDEETSELKNFIADTSDIISEIGADWKQLAGTSFVIVDSLSYFVKARDGAFWKLVFTKFVGSASGNTVFKKTRVTAPTGLNNNEASRIQVGIYPNPAQNSLNVLFEGKGQQSEVAIYGLNGQLVLQNSFEENGSLVHPIDISGLQEGIYLVRVTSGNSFQSVKLVVTR